MTLKGLYASVCLVFTSEIYIDYIIKILFWTTSSPFQPDIKHTYIYPALTLSTVQLHVVESITPLIDIAVFDVARPSKKVEAARSNANLIIIDVEEAFNRRHCHAQLSFEKMSSLWKAYPIIMGNSRLSLISGCTDNLDISLIVHVLS